jgi:hypothetical protein
MRTLFWFLFYCFCLQNLLKGQTNCEDWDQTNCNFTTIGKAENLGLYGVKNISDIKFGINNRLFLADKESFYSLYYSDDTATSWNIAFPQDSLFYDCGNKGWGGGSNRILSNQKGWVMADLEINNTYKIVFSQNNGDTASWRSIMDDDILNNLINNTAEAPMMELNDYHYYYSNSTYLFFGDTTDVARINYFNIKDSLFSDFSDFILVDFAVSNNITGLPLYFIVDSIEITTSKYKAGRFLYKYDGVNLTKLTGSSNFQYFTQICDNTSNGDTAFISGANTNGQLAMARTFDGGNLWQDLSLNAANLSFFSISYNSFLSSFYPSYTGIVLKIPQTGLSYDLGNTWQMVTGDFGGFDVMPSDTNYILAADLGALRLYTGGSGSLVTQSIMPENKNLNAVKVYQIDYDSLKSVFYLATSAGTAYTRFLYDTSITAEQKWESPYGLLRIEDLDLAKRAVSLNPWDSLNILYGSNMIHASTSGVNGFGTASSFNTTNPTGSVTDFEFLDANTIIAIYGCDNPDGNNIGQIFISYNNGLYWNEITPSGFNSGNIVTHTIIGSDTIIYVGSGMATEGGYIWKSMDKGKSWTQANTGPASSVDSTITSLPVLDIAIHPQDHNKIYIAAGHNFANYYCYGNFVKSIDGGYTYEQIEYEAWGPVSSVLIHPDHPDTVYFAASNRLYIYIESMDTVILGYQGMPGDLLGDLNYGSILAGTTTGFYSINLDLVNNVITELYKNLEDTDRVKLFPNPIKESETLKIFLSADDIAESTTIYNQIGEVVFHKQHQKMNKEFSIDIPPLAKGIYYLEIDGLKKIHNEKLIIY